MTKRRIKLIGFSLLGLAVAVLVGIAAIFLTNNDQVITAQEQHDAREAAFANLTKAHHTIDRIEFFGWNDEMGSAGVVMRGNRDGAYHIAWQVTEPASGQILAQGRETVSLGPGRRTVVIPLARDSLIEAYREKVLNGADEIVADVNFRLAATVEPALNPEESATLPPLEVQNLALGQSSLRSDVGIDLPVSFQVYDTPAIQTD